MAVLEGHFQAIRFDDVDGDGTQELLAIWFSQRQCPGIFTIYSVNGDERYRYVNSGHLFSFVTRESDGSGKKILIGGTNNLLDGAAVLIVLLEQDLQQSGVGPPYELPATFAGRSDLAECLPIDPPRASQRSYLAISRHNFAKEYGRVKWLYVNEIQADRNGLILQTNMGRGNHYPLYYSFDRQLEFLGASAGAETREFHASLLSRGLIDLPLQDFLRQRIEDLMLRDGNGWTNAALP